MTDTVEVVEEEKIDDHKEWISGYQSAVRYEAMTPEMVLIKLNELEAEGDYIKPSIRHWLKNRIRKN